MQYHTEGTHTQALFSIHLYIYPSFCCRGIPIRITLHGNNHLPIESINWKNSTSVWIHSQLSTQTHPEKNCFEAPPSWRCLLRTCWTGSWEHPWLLTSPCVAPDQPWWRQTTAERLSMTIAERGYWRSRALAHNPLGFALMSQADQRKYCSCCQWGEAMKLWQHQYWSCCYSLWVALQLLPYSCRKLYTRPSPPVNYYIWKKSDED